MSTRSWEALLPCSDCQEIVNQLNRRMPQLYESLGSTTVFVFRAIPDKDPETTTVDGHCSATNFAGASWSALRNSSGISASDNATTFQPTIRCDSVVDKWDVFRRGIATFDLSAIPDGATIISAEILLSMDNTVAEDDFGAASLVLVEATTASDTAIAAGDYDGFKTVEFADRLPFRMIGALGANTFFLNLDGINFIKLKIGGIAKFGFIVSYDFDDDEPAWVSGDQAILQIATSENASYQPPILVIRYSE